jgi:hypothetical protein
MPEDPRRAFLRHTLATLAYRGGKALRGAPPAFAGFKAGPETRTPGEILAHLSDLMDWGLSIARGKQEWHNSPVLSWEEGTKHFFASLKAFDDYLASDDPLDAPVDQLFHGPAADALTHVGQIAMLRRLGGTAMRGENYFRADIEAGRVGPDQSAPKREFD